MRKYAGDILNIVWQTEDNLMPDISRLTLTRARHICDPGADIGPWSQDTVRIMNRSGHWAESRGKVNLYIIRTTLSSQYTWVRPEARYLYTPEQVCAGTSSHIVERGDLQKDCLVEMLRGEESTFIESWCHSHIVCLLGQIQKSVFIPFHCPEELIISSLKWDWIP